jgi:hypothetical protein
VALRFVPRRAASALILALALTSGPGALGQQPDTPPGADAQVGDAKDRVDRLIEDAKTAIDAQQYDAARETLATVLALRPDDPEALFLLATADARQERWGEAIALYRRILADHPELARARLDLARALFEDGQDEEADYNFRLVLPTVPETVAGNIFGFLNQINARKRLTYSLSVGGVYDTDMNAATSVNQLTLFGLPFNLQPGRQAKSGAGVVVNAGAEYRYPLSGTLSDVRLRVGAALYRAEYFGAHGQFDDMIGRVQAGPQYIFDKGDVSLLAVASERWYGNDPYNWGYGPRAEADYSLTDRVRVQAGIEYTPDWYHTQTFQNGHLLTGLVTTFYSLTPASYVSLITGASKEHDASPDFSNLSYRIGIGYQDELPLGITAYIEPDLVLADYVAPSPAFGTTRRDRTWQVQLTLSKRDIRLWGFVPSFSYIFTQDVSNQSLFAYHRNQFLLGLTKAF